MTQLSDYSLPVADEASEHHTYHHHYEVLDVLDPDAGPCDRCGKSTVRLLATQYVDHNGYSYVQTLDFMYAHADGSEHHGRGNFLRPKQRCPRCLRYGTCATTQEAYGDRTHCDACGYDHWYDIGD